MITEAMLSKLVDEFLSAIFEKIKNGIVNSLFFTKLIGSIKPDFPQEDVSKIIKEAFDNVKKCNYLKDIDIEELKLLITDNGELIYSWIIGNKDFDPELLILQSDEQKKKHCTFMKQLYRFIKTARNSYLSISVERITKKLDVVQAQNNRYAEQLDRIETKLEWSFSKELNEIESKIKERFCHDAIIQLEALRTKIIQSRNDDEIEKFYHLYSDVYLANSETQQLALPYIKELISYAKDPFLNWYRKALYNLIDKNFDEVKKILDERNTKEIEGKNKQLYLSIKINYLMMSQQVLELDKFLNSVKEDIEEYPMWSMISYLAQGLYEKAVGQISLFKNDEAKRFHNRVLILQARVFNSITKIQMQGCSAEILNDLDDIRSDIDKVLEDAHDDKASKKTLLILKGMILQNTSRIDDAYIVYQQVESLGENCDPNFLRNYAMVLMFKNKFEESLLYIKRTLELVPNDMLSLEVYFSALCEINPQQAEQELLAYKESAETIDIKLKLIRALVKQDKIKSAEERLLELENKYPDNADVIFEKGEMAFLKGNTNDAFKYFTESIKTTPSHNILFNAERSLLQIGLSQRNKEHIIEVLAIIGDVTYEHLSIMGYEIIYAMILLGQIVKSHLLIKKMKEFKLLSSCILRLEMSCQFHSKNYEKVIEIYKSLKTEKALVPEDQKVYLFSLYYLGKRDSLLEAIDLLPAPSNPNELIMQTQTIRNIGVFDKAIKLARDGYKKYPNNQNIMENFIQMVLTRGMEQIDDGILKDFCECRDSYFKNPNPRQNFKSIQIPTDAKGEDILRVLAENLPEQKRFDYLFLLNEHHFHISILANKFNYLFLWKSVLELPQYKVFISDCSITDLKDQYERITDGDVLIDLPSLITCAYLNILPCIAQFFGQVYISQDSIGILESAKNTQYNTFGENCTSDLYQLNNYVYPEKEIDYSDLSEYLKRIYEFRENDNVHVVGIQLEPESTPSEKLIQFCRKANLLENNDILYAYSSNIQIMLESYTSRVIMKEFAPHICCFEIEAVLVKLLNRKKMRTERYFESVYKLLQAKYYYIFFDYNFIAYYLDKNRYSESEEIVFLQKLLISDAYLKEWVMGILTNLIIHTFIIKENDISIITFVLKWINIILKLRSDFTFNERLLFFKSLYDAIPNENIKQIIYQVWEEDVKTN